MDSRETGEGSEDGMIRTISRRHRLCYPARDPCGDPALMALNLLTTPAPPVVFAHFLTTLTSVIDRFVHLKSEISCTSGTLVAEESISRSGPMAEAARPRNLRSGARR